MNKEEFLITIIDKKDYCKILQRMLLYCKSWFFFLFIFYAGLSKDEINGFLHDSWQFSICFTFCCFHLISSLSHPPSLFRCADDFADSKAKILIVGLPAQLLVVELIALDVVNSKKTLVRYRLGKPNVYLLLQYVCSQWLQLKKSWAMLDSRFHTLLLFLCSTNVPRFFVDFLHKRVQLHTGLLFGLKLIIILSERRFSWGYVPLWVSLPPFGVKTTHYWQF